MIPTERFEKVEVSSLAELRDWLAANHGRSEGVWLVRHRKSVPGKFIDRLDLLDELLCFGWVDGIARKIDDQRTMQLIFPRKQQAGRRATRTEPLDWRRKAGWRSRAERLSSNRSDWDCGTPMPQSMR